MAEANNYARCLRLHTAMENAARIADLTGNEAVFERASDINLDGWAALLEYGTDDQKAKAGAFMVEKYGWDSTTAPVG